MTVPANNRGAIWFTPTFANDLPIAYSTSTNATTVALNGSDVGMFTGNSALTAGITRILQPAAPFASSIFHQGFNRERSLVQARVVSFGVKITNVTPPLYRGGTALTYVSPRHQNVAGLSYSTCASQSLTRMQSVGSQPIELALSAVNEAELEYADAAEGVTLTQALYPYSGGANGFPATYDSSPTSAIYTDTVASVLVGVPVACVYFDPSGQNQTFNVEIVNHMEYIGDSVQPFVTPNEADDVGLNKVEQAKESIQEILASNPYTTAKAVAGKALKASFGVVKEMLLDHVTRSFDSGAYAAMPRPIIEWALEL